MFKTDLAGVVVAYNPEISIVSNIKSYINFLDILYVIDNSESINLKVKESICEISDKIIYVSYGNNFGVAKAINDGCKNSIADGCKWILTMDQDSYFFQDTFFKVWRDAVEQDNTVAVIAASFKNVFDRWKKSFSENFDEIHYVITSGNILSLEIWNEVGGFEEKLFIDEVDHDYCIKLRTCGYKIVTSKSVFIGHMLGENYNLKLYPKKIVAIHSPLRQYYITRNTLYVSKKFFLKDPRFAWHRLHVLTKNLGKIILLYPDKRRYIKYFFYGFKDFIMSKYGRFSSI